MSEGKRCKTMGYLLMFKQTNKNNNNRQIVMICRREKGAKLWDIA